MPSSSLVSAPLIVRADTKVVIVLQKKIISTKTPDYEKRIKQAVVLQASQFIQRK
jgi:hypothetical protein